MNKTSHIKELFTQTTIYGVGILLNRSVSFILLPVYTYFFSPKDLGLYNLIQSLWIFVILIYVYGMETSFIKFFIDSKDDSSRKEIYSSTLVLLSITSLLFSVILYFSSSSIVELINFEDKEKGISLIKILCFLLLFDTLSRFPLLLLRAQLKSKIYFYLSSAGLIINLLLNIYLILFLKQGIESILYSYAISVIFILLSGLVITRKYISYKINLQLLKKLVLYGNKFIYYGLFLLLIEISDRFFLKYFFNESIVGIYSANYRLASIMSLCIAAFKFSWTPYFLNLSENPENKKIISEVFTYFVFVGLSLFLFFSFFTESIAILLSYFFSGLFANLTVVPFYSERTAILFFISLEGIAINTIFNFLLIPKYQMNGAAFATLATYVIMFAHLYFDSQKVYKINYDWKKIFTISLLAFILFFIQLYFNRITIGSLLLQFIQKVILLITFLFILNQTKVIKLSNVKLIFKRNT